MTDDLRSRIAAAIQSIRIQRDGDAVQMADAVMEVITAHVPPIVASAIQGYAQSELVAMSYHGDPAGLASMKRLNREAAGIANYATTHQKWNGSVNEQ